MPSVTHEAPIELIRQNPGLAVELLRAMTGLRLPVDIDVSLGPTDLSEVVPVKFLADATVVVADRTTGKPVLVIVVEPQGRDAPTKQFAWPAYLTLARSHAKCRRAFLLVICPDPREARKCRRVIRTGHPGFDLRPEVIDASNIPGARNASPYLVIFAAYMGAISLNEDIGVRTFLKAVRGTGASGADRKRLATIMLNLASDAARRRLETMMTTMEWKSDFIESYVPQGVQQGEVKAKAEGVIKIIDTRGIHATDQQRDRVSSCTDIAQLDEWFDRALVAASAADIFKG